jgi:hypothetical protein
MKRKVVTATMLIAAFAAAMFGQGFAHRRHAPVAPWDFVDPSNSHPLTLAGPFLKVPTGAIHARGYEAVTPFGVRLKLLALNKGNTQNPDHMWSPNGGLFADDGSWIPNLPDRPAENDGPRRDIVLQQSGLDPHEEIVCYVAGSTPSKLIAGDKPNHGWGFPIRDFNSFRGRSSKTVYLDHPEASQFVVGFAHGGKTTVDSFPNSIPAPPYLDKVLASGPWGTAKVIFSNYEWRDHSKARMGGGPDAMAIQIQTKEEPSRLSYSLVGYEAKGETHDFEGTDNLFYMSKVLMRKIVRFELVARPICYVAFDHVHFDPDPKLWENMAWGDIPPANSKNFGGVNVGLQSLCTTKVGTEPYNDQQYVSDQVFTGDGKLWRDRPPRLQQMGTMLKSLPHMIIPVYKPGMSFKDLVPRPAPEVVMPKPFIATVKFESSAVDPDIQYRAVIGGSNSPIGGVDFHPDWNGWPSIQDQYGYFLPIYKDLEWWSFSLPAKANFVQMRIDTVSGPWTSFKSFEIPVAKIKRPVPDYRDFSFEIANNIKYLYLGLDDKRHVDKVGHFDLGRFQSRVVAHLKNGSQRVLKITSFDRERVGGPLLPTYDFGLDKPMEMGDFNGIALKDVARLEIQTRPICRGYLVARVPRT